MNIPEDILKVKQEVDSEFFGADPSWIRGENNVIEFVLLSALFEFVLFLIFMVLMIINRNCPLCSSQIRLKVDILSQMTVNGVIVLHNFHCLPMRDPGRQ